MKKYLLTYASGDRYETFQRKMEKRAKFNAQFDDVLMWGPQDISQDFKRKHRRILSQPIGAGLWLWKPYIILQALKKVAKDSIVFYCDVDHIVVGLLDKYFDFAQENDIVLFDENGIVNRSASAYECTASGTFSYMNCARDRYFSRRMVVGGYNFWKSDVKAISFVREWLYWCCNENVLLPAQVDVNSIGAVLSRPQDLETTQYGARPVMMHCFDQSVLTILAEKYNIGAHQTPVFSGELQELDMQTGKGKVFNV